MINVKKIILKIVLHVVAKTENIYQELWMIQQLRMMKLYAQKKQFLMKKI